MVIRELVAKLGFDVDNASISAFNTSISKAKQGMLGLTQQAQNMGRSIRNVGFGFTVGLTLPIAATGFAALKTAASLEKAKIALEVFLGSEEKALALQKELIAFAAKTPFQILGIQETAGQLLAAGIESKKLIPTLNALGNAAKGNAEVFQRLVLNFAQVQTQGKLTGRELRDFLVNQVPLVKLLAKELGVAESAIQDMVSRGEISFGDLEKAFLNASKEGGFFFNLMIKQSTTLSGKWSNLTDTVSVFLNEIGIAIERTFNLKKNMDRLIRGIAFLTDKFKNLNPRVKSAIVIFATLLALIGPVLIIVGTLITTIAAAVGGFILVKVAIAAVGVTLGALVIIGIKVAAVIAALSAAVFLFFDDLSVWISGGDSVLGVFLGSFTRFKNGVMTVLNAVTSIFSTFWAAIRTNGDAEWNAFIDSVINGVKIFGKLLLEVGERIAGGIGKAFAGAILVAEGLIIGLFKALNALTKRIVGFATNIGARIMEGLKSTKIGGAVAKFFGAGSDGGGSAFDKFNATSPPITPPAGVLSSAAAGVSNKSAVVNQNISVAVPPGTSEQQVTFLEKSATAIFEKQFNAKVAGAILAAPRGEK